MLTIHPVLRAVAPPCDDLVAGASEVVVVDPSTGAPDRCLVLGPAGVDATSITEAELVATATEDVLDVAVELDERGGGALDAMAGVQYLTHGSLAILVHGRLVAAPTVEAPELGTSVLVSGLSVAEAVDLVTAIGGDPTLPERDPASADLDRATAACNSRGGDAGPALAVAPTTAGSITAALGDHAIEPWRSLPADHFVARCGYAPLPTDAPRTTVCPDGETVSLTSPEQWLVDEEGRSTPDPAGARGPISPC